MQVLCFAHRLEALAFFDYSQCQNLRPNVFKSEDFYILITNEGMQAATESLTEFLALTLEITSVINLGAAAGNLNTLNINQVYPVRTLYRQKADTSMEFTSFTTKNVEANSDIISAESRIQSETESEKLFSFAQIIDREAWALASVSKRFKKDFYCFKYISDDATQKACSQVRDIADKISKSLLETYLSFQPNTKTIKQIDLPDGYHFTFTQKNDFEKLLQKISLQKNIAPENILTALPAFDAKKPKDRTKLLLEFLFEQLDPFTHKIRNQLNQLTSPYQNESLKITYDKTLESDELELHLKFSTPEELKAMIENLKDFPYTSIQELLRGNDVE